MEQGWLEPVHGAWNVQNADRGEILSGPDECLVTGGTFLIDARSGTVAAALAARTGDARSTRIRLAGLAAPKEDAAFSAHFGDGTEMTFERLADGRLARVAYSGGTREAEMILAPTDSAIPEKVRDDTLVAPILFNTMPKSGSIYILRCLSLGLGIAETKIAVCLFPEDLILRDRLDVLSRGNLIAQQHIPAHDLNLRFLASRLDRMVVHLRDPRQATLSWLHHLDNFHVHRDIVPACKLGLEAVSPALPADYFERGFSDRLDYLLATHYPQLIAWTEGWVSAARNAGDIDIRITTFEDFVADPDAFIRALLNHYRVPQSAFDFSNLPRKEAATHFRKGRTDEWKDVFSPDQQKLARDLLPDTLAAQFGWPTDIAG